MIGTDAQTPPTVKGFSASATDLVAWVYDTAECDSVPLMSAVLAAESDYYYTTDPDEHAALLALGGLMVVLLHSCFLCRRSDTSVTIYGK